MSESKFKTMRHIETVRNYMDAVIRKLTMRACEHDQSKLKEPEVSIFEEYTPKLRDCTYGSKEYKGYLEGMTVGLKHHYKFNRHHPEHFVYQECNGCFKRFDVFPNRCDVCGYSQWQERVSGIEDMNLIDLIEMICDWKAATLRHNDGDINESIEINQERFGFTDELKMILINTVTALEGMHVYHNADES